MTVQLNLFDLNLLRSLDALLIEKSVTRAAEKVHVTQQAMSGSLKRLREHFGDELLVRIGVRMELTPLGAALVTPVREAILQIGMALGTTPAFNPVTTRRRFRLAMSDYVAVTIFPMVLKRVLAATPGMVCDIHPLDDSAFAGLETGDLDMSILPSFWREREVQRPEGVRSAPLYDDDFVCAIDPIVHTFDEMTLERYLTLPHSAVRMAGGHRTIIDDAWDVNRISPRVAVTTTSYSNVMFVIPGTPMIATVQRRLARLFEGLVPIRFLECPISIGPLNQELSWHSRNDDDPAHAYLRDQLMAAAREMDAPPTV